MKFYEFDADTRSDLTTYRYFGTLSDAHDRGKMVIAANRPHVRITEVEVPTDKATVLLLLNETLNLSNGRQPAPLSAPIVASRGRQWSLTPRGGLRDIEPENKADGTT